MTILLVGGGSGGHITPLLAVAHEIKAINSGHRVIYVEEKGSKFSNIAQSSEDIDAIRSVRAGKFRRYHGESLFKKIIDIKSNILNIRDFFYLIVGLIQSLYLIVKLKPDAVFMKGGFVGVPVGLACALRGVSFITHDSDTLPGLANRLVGRWAKVHAVGMPKEFYSYPAETTVFTGIPVAADYSTVTEGNKKDFKKALGIDVSYRVICITGGSLGATRLNKGVAESMVKILKQDSKIFIIHQTGLDSSRLYSDLDKSQAKRVMAMSYFDNLYACTGAAEIIIARAGATTIAELSIQKKPVIIVPNPLLTGGHQLKNAEHLRHSGAAVVVTEEDLTNPDNMVNAVNSILKSRKLQTDLSSNLSYLAKPKAAKDIAKIIIGLK